LLNASIKFDFVRLLQNVQFCSSSRKAKILTVRLSLPKTTGIYRIFRGLKFETDAEIGQKGTLCKGLIVCANQLWTYKEIKGNIVKKGAKEND